MKTENFKSVALVAREAAAEVMRRDVSDHGAEGSVRRALVDAWRDAAESDFLARIGFHLTQGELTAVSMLNGAPYNPRMGGRPPTDAMWLLSSDQEAKALELLGQQAPDIRLVFTTPARPLEIPALLRALPLDTPIRTREDFGGGSGSSGTPAGEYVDYLEAIMRRQSEGYFTVSEAAQVLADANPDADVRALLEKMRRAIFGGVLVVRDSGDKLPKTKTDTLVVFRDLVRVSDIDAWLVVSGVDYRFPAPNGGRSQRQPGQVLRLERGTAHVRFGDLAHLIADALWPDQGPDDNRLHYAGARLNLEAELSRAVDGRLLRVLDPLTLGPHTFPLGDALRRAKVAVADLRQWLHDTRRMDVVVTDPEPAKIASPPKPVQRQRAQEAAVLAKLVELDYSPESLPMPLPGKASAPKQAVKEALGYSDNVMEKAWKRLRADGRIKDAP